MSDLERAAAFGVLGLDDLIELPTIGRHPQAAKLRHTSKLPRAKAKASRPRPNLTRQLLPVPTDALFIKNVARA